MSLSLLQNATACGLGITVPFEGTGGTSPYTYTIIPGGVGGSINPSGLYTAPFVTGPDTIQVQDSLGAIATAEILVANALELFCDIIQTQLGLAQGKVYLYDQKINMPTDSGLFVAVGIINPKPFGNTRIYDSSSGFNSIQSINMKTMLSVDIISRGPEARDRKEEVIMAFNSFYSQQQQEANSFNIGIIPTSFVNLSQVDGAAIPYRFTISVNVQYFVTKVLAVPYFSNFSTPSVLTNP